MIAIMDVTKRKALTDENEKLWAAAEAKRRRSNVLRDEWRSHSYADDDKDRHVLYQSNRLRGEADEEQANIIVDSQVFQETTDLDITLAVVKHYEDIIKSGKCISGCRAGAISKALDTQFEKRFPAKKTDEDIALVRVIGNAAWSALVTCYNDSPRWEDQEGMSTNGWLGYTLRLNHTNTECRLLTLAIRMCLKSPTCANALIDCATALGVTDELYYQMLGVELEIKMGKHKFSALIHAHPALLGRNSTLALGYANHCTVEYWLPDAHFNGFVELVKSKPAWFALPRLVRNLAGPGHLSDTKEALRALRVLACLHPAFLHRERVDLGHLIDALKGNKKHLKRLETLAAKIEDPKHRDMAAEHAAAMAMGLDG